MRHFVIDASAIVDLLLSRRSRRLVALFVADDVQLHAPSLCDVEVASAIRGALLGGRLEREAEARAILDDLFNLPVERYESGSLMQRAFDLRHNFSTYDASYVALAEALGTPLLTADAGLAAATRAHTAVLVELVTEG